MNLMLPQATLTAEEFLTLPDAKRFELVDGKLVELQMGTESSYVGGRLFRRLADFCEEPFCGWVLPAETTFQFLANRPNVVRKPDVAFIRAGRLPEERLPRGHTRLAPDLAAEVVSPNDVYYDVEDKIAEYRAGGVRLIWILVPPTRTILIRRLDGSAAEVREDGELSGEDVIPGFRCAAADLFRMPAPPAAATQQPI
jgi:Uma2 family endonuclease